MSGGEGGGANAPKRLALLPRIRNFKLQSAPSLTGSAVTAPTFELEAGIVQTDPDSLNLTQELGRTAAAVQPLSTGSGSSARLKREPCCSCFGLLDTQKVCLQY